MRPTPTLPEVPVERSIKRLSLLFLCLLPLAVSQAPGCVPPCDTHTNNVPAGIEIVSASDSL